MRLRRLIRRAREAERNWPLWMCENGILSSRWGKKVEELDSKQEEQKRQQHQLPWTCPGSKGHQSGRRTAARAL